jgi:hypothetical protein
MLKCYVIVISAAYDSDKEHSLQVLIEYQNAYCRRFKEIRILG